MKHLAILLLLLSIVTAAPAAKAQIGALQTDCRLGGAADSLSYQFVATCAGRSSSPNRRFAIVQHAYDDKQPPIEFQDARGRTLTRLRTLSDDMPFSVSWAPNSRWFFVNHHVGSFMDVLQIFEIVGRSAVERPLLVRSAVKLATRRYPCLLPASVLPNGARWAGDSRRIVLVTISAPYACTVISRKHGTWQSLWMIGDVQSGLIDPKSIRVQPNDKPFQAPHDGPYAHF
jgi:hypothetical protein